MTYPKKLIEVALPLESINREAAREKSIRHGHPSTLHLWWARRPLAACRAVIFAQMVDDPGSHPELFPTEEAQNAERERLFNLLRELVKWENVNNETLLAQARAEIRRWAPNSQPPPLLDPFAGGGSIPLEAQRLGLEAHASDLNPVAVLINKALIEIPPKFAGMAPVSSNAEAQGRKEGRNLGVSASLRLIPEEWRGARGLAEDVRYYGQWMRDEAEKRIGHLYPKADGKTVIAWLWARTVTCPNPACQARMPLVRSFALSTKKGKQAWVEPVVERGFNAKAQRRRDKEEDPLRLGVSALTPAVRFEVRTGAGKPQEPPKIGRGAKFRCLVCGQLAEDQHIKDEGVAGRMGAQLMAIVAEGHNGRIYLVPDPEHERVAQSAQPTWRPNQPLAGDKRAIWCTLYGLDTFDKLFTPRQLVALTTFSDLVGEARARVEQDARAAGLSPEQASAYADAVATYLAFAVDRLAMTGNSLVRWNPVGQKAQHAFGRQALPMLWDFAEPNFFGDATGSISAAIELAADPLSFLNGSRGFAQQADVKAIVHDRGRQYLLSTDPPYYDNIGYADLSDFFYVWLRRSLNQVFPELFRTLLVPKAEELVATPYRFGGDKAVAQEFFETGLRQAFGRIREISHPAYPLTVYYAFKQAEADDDDDDGEINDNGSVSTGWETMLEGLIRSGFQITGTWPMRTEMRTRQVAMGTNALASSVVLVCRPKTEQAPLATRREFLAALKRELPAALKHLQQGNIAPVDLAQASIGPGMAIYSRYGRVLESDGQAMRVRAALALINQALDEYLAEQEGEYDADTRWALAWFEQHAFAEGAFGDAETLSKAKNTSVEGMVQAGILHARAGKVRLLRREELAADWDPASDRRVTVWEVTQHLIRTVDERGEQAAAALLAQVGGLGEVARDLAYRLYTICERKGWASEALPYNGLVVAWPELVKLAEEARRPTQTRLGL